MAQYDDWVYDRGLEGEDWVHDRWGDDDDDWDDDWDDDICSNNTGLKKENNKMHTKNFFKNIKVRNESNGARWDLIIILKNNEFIALDSEDGNKYTIYVQQDVQELASVFGINLKNIRCENLTKANEKFLEYKQLITVTLVAAIMKYNSEKGSFREGNIDFIDMYSDKQTLNNMVNAVNNYFGDDTFSKMRSICKKFALNLDLSPLQNELNENIKNRENSRYRSDIENYDNKVKRLYDILTAIKSANCVAPLSA